MIGINSAMSPIGILLFSPIIPVLAKRFGSRNVAIAAAVVTALVFLSYRVFDTFSAWFVIRLVQGMSISTLFVLSEAWIVGSTGDHNRGKIVAIYASVLSASFGAGPLLISFIGIDGWTPFVLGAGVVAAGIIPFIFIRDDAQPEHEETQPSSILISPARRRYCWLRSVPSASSTARHCRSSRSTACRTDSGIPTSANILSAMILGNVFLQFPIGWLCDRFPTRYVHGGLRAGNRIGTDPAAIPVAHNPAVAVAGDDGHHRLRGLHGVAGRAR